MLLSNSFKCSAVALTSAGSYVKVGNAQIGQMLMFGHTRASSKAVPLVTQVLEILRKSRISSGKKRSSAASLPLPSPPPGQLAPRAGAPRAPGGLAAAGLRVSSSSRTMSIFWCDTNQFIDIGLDIPSQPSLP